MKKITAKSKTYFCHILFKLYKNDSIKLMDILHATFVQLIQEKLISAKGGNPLPKFNVGGGGGGTYSKPCGVRALAIIDYWSRGPKATYIFWPWKRRGVL